jgi:spore coat protein JB
MSEDIMMRKVQMLSFVLVDVGLFLDTHPYDEAALRFFDKYRALYDSALAEYEETYGPLTRAGVDIDDGWSWINNPWPWEMEE